MAFELTQARAPGDLDGLERVVREYLEWDIAQLRALSGSAVDAEDYVRHTFAEIGAFPARRLPAARPAGRRDRGHGLPEADRHA